MILFLLLFVGCLLVQVVFPWWSVALVCLLGGFWRGRSGVVAFGSGFLAVAGGWALAAAVPWFLTGSVLAERVATLLKLPGGGPVLLVLMALVGGLVGGIAALAGWWLRMTRGRSGEAL